MQTIDIQQVNLPTPTPMTSDGTYNLAPPVDFVGEQVAMDAVGGFNMLTESPYWDMFTFGILIMTLVISVSAITYFFQMDD